MQLNQYLPVWLLSGFVFGIFAYRFIPNQIILILISAIILFLFYCRNLYSRFLLSGLVLACVRLSIEANFRKHKKDKITFGRVHVVGQLDYNDKANILSIHRMLDSAGRWHNGHKVILTGAELPKHGDFICCEGDLIPLAESYIPGSIDSRFNLFFKNIIGFLNINTYNALPLKRPNLIQQLIRDRLAEQFPAMVQGLLVAILLGDPAELDKNLYEKMVLLGISHLMVVSAMHFGLFSSIYYFIFRYSVGLLFPNYIPIQRGAKFAALFGSCLYFSLINHNWSVLRSFISIILSILIILFKKNLNAFQVTCTTVLIMLFLYPYAVFDLGFQLSIVSVLTLILFKTNLITSTLYVTLTTAPFILYQHGYLNLQPFLASIVCIPFFSFILMPLTVLGLNTYFPPWISKLLIISSDLFFSCVDKLSTILIFPIYYYITGTGLLLISVAFVAWVLLRNRIITTVLLLLGILMSIKKHYLSILIDRNLKDIFLYSHGIVYTNNLESWKVGGVKKFFNARNTFDIPDNFKTNKGYFWHNYEITIGKDNKFNELRVKNLVLVKKWDLISHRSPVLVTFKKNIIIIKFNDDIIKVI